MDKVKIQSRFSKAAHSYNSAAKVQKQAVEMNLAVVDQLSLEVNRLIDLGCGTGLAKPALIQRFGSESYHALDLSVAMLSYAQQQDADQSPSICADIACLPLADQTMDLMLSNSTLQWCNDLVQVFADCRRVLSAQGVFVFSTFGPGTLKELRQAFSSVDSSSHVGHFLGQHDIEAALRQAGFTQFELNAVECVIEYQRPMQLLRDIKATGANYHKDNAGSLYARSKLMQMLANYPASDANPALYPASYEVIYGYAKTSK